MIKLLIGNNRILFSLETIFFFTYKSSVESDLCWHLNTNFNFSVYELGILEWDVK